MTSTNKSFLSRAPSRDVEQSSSSSKQHYPYQTFPSTDTDSIDPTLVGSEKEEEKKAFLNRISFLALIPLVIVTILFFKTFTGSNSGGSSASISATSMTTHKSSSASPGPPGPSSATSTDDDCVSCPTMAHTSYCADTAFPVLGGIDVVGTYQSYNSSSTYQTVGVTGLAQYSETYGGYTFYFANAANKVTFASNPTKYLPQWGGFCSWGIATEFCPSYPWSDTCLGPSGNWYAWTVQQEKMFFFLKKTVLVTFLENTTAYIETGDARWKSWFGDRTVLSTQCYVVSDA